MYDAQQVTGRINRTMYLRELLSDKWYRRIPERVGGGGVVRFLKLLFECVLRIDTSCGGSNVGALFH